MPHERARPNHLTLQGHLLLLVDGLMLLEEGEGRGGKECMERGGDGKEGNECEEREGEGKERGGEGV